MDISPHKSDFVEVNGIRLHYLDWGGLGQTLIFLTGMGNSAHLFDRIAPRFSDQFRVIALTRRGQGESDTPDRGYDLDTLVDDILDFLDCLHVEKAILVGHSLAGTELTRFAEKYPEKVIKLVYLDAVYDGKGRANIIEQDPLETIAAPVRAKEFISVQEVVKYIKYIRPDLAQVWNECWDISITVNLVQDADGSYRAKDRSSAGKQMFETLASFDPQNVNIQVPVLSFVAIFHAPMPEYLTEEQEKAVLDFENEIWFPFQQREVEKFKNDIPQGRVIELQDSHHYCFIAQEDIVYEETRKFLSE